MFEAHRRRDPMRIQQYQYEIKRLSDAQQMMLDANAAVARCDRGTLLRMGFEADHIEDLLRRNADGKKAFGDHCLRNNTDAIEHLNRLLAAENRRRP